MNNKNIIPTLHPEQFRNNYLIKGMDTACSSLNFNYFHVHKVESSCTKIKFPLPPYRNTVHECILLTDGYMVRSLGLEKFTVKSGDVFILPAGQISTFENASDSITGYYCHFSTSFLVNKYFSAALLKDLEFLTSIGNPIVSLPKKGVKDFVQLFKRMETELFNPNTEDLLQSYLLTLLIELKQHYKPSETRSISPAQYLTDRFKELIAQNYKSNMLVSEYAEILNVTPNHLNKTIKNITGKTSKNWIDELILIEAKVLLHQTSLSITDVSYELGIEDPSYFGRMFKKYENRTPSEYRRLLR